MPRLNGAQAPPMAAEYEATLGLFEAFRGCFIEQLKGSTVDPMVFSRLSLVALTQLAAMVAVDVGMQPQQFLDVCGANFKSAFERAPRFG